MSDGGSAFPGPERVWDGRLGEYAHPTGTPGMTLRDYFAAKAMQALIANPLLGHDFSTSESAYEYADAMLKARESS